MAEMNQGVVLNDEYSPQDFTRALLAQCHPHSSLLSLSTICSTRNVENETMEDVEMDGRKFAGIPSNSEENASLRHDVDELQHKMTYISHQVTLLLNALHVPSCQCPTCKPMYETQVGLFNEISQGAARSVATSSSARVENEEYESKRNGSVGQPKMEEEVIEATPITAANNRPTSRAPSVNDCEALLSQIFTQTCANLAGGLSASLSQGSQPPKPFVANTATNNQIHQCPNPGGRKSKYCSAEEKKAVAEYAQLHGPSAAARKFGIPPPVAAYYHRKEFRQNKTMSSGNHIMPTVNAASPGTISGDDLECTNDEWHNPVSNTVVNDTLKQQDQIRMTNPAHSTGSPGFLRGRGRGRPKLIGDELDAELVDYMVQVKQSDPRGHLTASQALSIARVYIMEKAPGLLEEHGGQIKLKLTWAMKLVSRIAERQKEMELGLPAGAISTVSRTIPNSSVNMPGGNFMADMMAHNLINQQATHIVNQSTRAGGASATPQILNVRELELPKYGNKCSSNKEEMDDNMEGENDDDVGDEQYENGIENQQSLQ